MFGIYQFYFARTILVVRD